jgi:hypothetical protein
LIDAAFRSPPERRGNAGRWKARKTQKRFPSLPTALGNRWEGAIPTFPPRRQLYLSKTQNRKEHPGAGLFPLSSGSSFDEKMLIVYLLIASAAGWLAWRDWGQLGREWPGDGGGAMPRSRFMAAIGVMIAALSVLAIIAQGIATIILSPCQ